MINITNKSIIYVIAPAHHHTGGVELSHQLVDYLRNNQLNCYIVYLLNTKIIEAEVVDEYKKYNIASTTIIEDNSENVLIIPEIYSSLLRNYYSIQIGYWWMSIDNYFKSAPLYERLAFNFKKKNIKLLCIQFIEYIYSKSEALSFLEMKNNNSRITHLYQSTYAKHYLLNKGFYNLLPLKDYISTEFLSNNKEYTQKQDIILYNPKKGYEFTKIIIQKLSKCYTFIPLQNLSKSQLNEYFSKAKLYIDFGNHPGKDRLPREAAINGCCVITSTDGSAKYFEDFPVDNSYKFERRKKSIRKIINKIHFVMCNYDKCNVDFDFYRKNIIKEKEEFYREIVNIFFK